MEMLNGGKNNSFCKYGFNLKIKNMKKVSKATIGLLFCVVSMMSSCVQGDLYDLYEDELCMMSQVPRNKKTKENVVSEAQCGICCMAYLKYGNVDGQSIGKIIGFAEKLNISTDNALTSGNIADICESNGIGNITTWVGIRYTVNGQTITIRDYVIQQLNTGKIPVIIQKESNHWVVGTSINTNSQTVNYLDPKYTDYSGYNLQGSVSFNQIDCLVY